MTIGVLFLEEILKALQKLRGRERVTRHALHHTEAEWKAGSYQGLLAVRPWADISDILFISFLNDRV